jgi:phosphotransacetylase
MYNINKGRNKELLSRSENLAGYAEFVARVRENQQAGISLEEAVTGAIRRCIRDGILAPFLEEHGSEVMDMLLKEWDWDMAKEVWQEEAMEKGMEKERNQILELIKRGYTTEQIEAKLTEDSPDRR